MGRRVVRPLYSSQVMVSARAMRAMRAWRLAWTPWQANADVSDGVIPGVLRSGRVGHLLIVWSMTHPGPGDAQYQRGWQTGYPTDLVSPERPLHPGLWYVRRQASLNGGVDDQDRARYVKDVRRLQATSPQRFELSFVLLTSERQRYSPPMLRGLLWADECWRDIVVQVELEEHQ